MAQTENIELLVKQAKKNNRLAQKKLFIKYHPELLGLCVRILGCKDSAEDALQDAFIKAFNKLKKLKEVDKFPGWLKRIAINECMNHLKFNSNLKLTDEPLEKEMDDGNNSWFENIPFEKIKLCIDELPDGCRQIFTLYVIEDYKHNEIAEMLNISVSTAKSQYQYSIKLLRQQLKQCYYDNF